MHLPSVFRLVATATLVVCQSSNNTTGKPGDARPVRNNPVIGEVWMAKFDSPTVKGFVTAVANTVGVNYTIDVTGLPVEQGPFKYHVHLHPVPSDGNCADTAGHLDSYLRGDSPPCNSAAPQTCEVGDLSGKYGMVTGPSVLKSFNDPYSALNVIDLGYIGNRGIVFHDARSARIACAALQKAE